MLAFTFTCKHTLVQQHTQIKTCKHRQTPCQVHSLHTRFQYKCSKTHTHTRTAWTSCALKQEHTGFCVLDGGSVSWAEGGLASTPVFAAVIRGTYYFGVASMCSHAHTHSQEHRVALSERGVHAGWCFLWVESVNASGKL